MEKNKSVKKTETKTPACSKGLPPPTIRKNDSWKKLGFITNARLTTSFTSVKNMFTRKVESKPLLSKRKHSSKKKLFSEAIVHRSDSAERFTSPGSSKGLLRRTPNRKKRDGFDEHGSSSSANHKIERFLDDLKNRVQSPVPNSVLRTPATEFAEKPTSRKLCGASEELGTNDGASRETESLKLSADSKKFYQDVFAKEMIETFVGMTPKFRKKDIVADLKKKLRESYLANEEERTAYVEGNLAEELHSQDWSIPGGYENHQSQNVCDMAVDPYDFLANFNPKPPDIVELEICEPLTPMSFLQQQCVINDIGPFSANRWTGGGSAVSSDFRTRESLIEVGGFSGGAQTSSSSEFVTSEVRDRLSLPSSSGGPKGTLPFVMKEPEFKYYRRMLY